MGCAVLGSDVLTVGRADEIELSHGFFDYVEKYNLITSRIHMPARIPPEQEGAGPALVPGALPGHGVPGLCPGGLVPHSQRGAGLQRDQHHPRLYRPQPLPPDDGGGSACPSLRCWTPLSDWRWPHERPLCRRQGTADPGQPGSSPHRRACAGQPGPGGQPLPGHPAGPQGRRPAGPAAVRPGGPFGHCARERLPPHGPARGHLGGHPGTAGAGVYPDLCGPPGVQRAPDRSGHRPG